MGVSATGPVAGSAFAALQSTVGSIGAGGLMAGVQSLAMGGLGNTSLAVAAAGAATAAAAATAKGRMVGRDRVQGSDGLMSRDRSVKPTRPLVCCSSLCFSFR